jgi:phosphate transport system substrate-binding protein
MRLNLLAPVFAALSCASFPAAAGPIHIVGSGTVFPFAAEAAEQFGKAGQFKTPIVEATGTGGGFKLFCGGAGPETPDINDASRAMVEDEEKLCQQNNVGKITEITIGYDGIVIARQKQPGPAALTRKDIFLALARDIPQGGKLIRNSAQSWRDVNPALPETPIKIYGTSPASGTRDAFVEMVMVSSCKDLPEFRAAYPETKAREHACGLIREDGKFIEAGEDYNATAQKLTGDASAIAIFGYSFFDQNRAIIQAVNIDGVAPAPETIAGGSYKLARKLYLYIKNAHVGKTPGLAEFAQEITSETAIGPDGYMTAKGLVPLPDAARAKERAKAAMLK